MKLMPSAKSFIRMVKAFNDNFSCLESWTTFNSFISFSRIKFQQDHAIIMQPMFRIC